jgi:hypothetical protein
MVSRNLQVLGALDSNRFETILKRHGLLEKWRQFERQFLGS